MMMRVLLVIVLWLVTVVGHLPRVEVLQGCQTFSCLHILVPDELTVVEGYEGEHLVHFLLSVVGIQIVS